MAAVAYYTQGDFEKIIYEGVNYTIPNDILQRIMELEARMKAKAAASSNSYEVKSNRRVVTGDKRVEKKQWARPAEPVFQPHKIVAKKGRDKLVQTIMLCLNKITKANYESQMQEVHQSLDELVAENELVQELVQEPSVKPCLHLKPTVQDIYSVCMRNIGMGDVYADLYAYFCESEQYAAVFREILQESVDGYRAGFAGSTLPDDPTKRRSNAKFLALLLKRGVVDSAVYGETVAVLLRAVDGYVENKAANLRDELEDATENLFILLSLTAEQGWTEETRPAIERFSKVVVKEAPNMTSRAKFKFQDLLKL